jgi:hypothetical protein
MTGFLALLCVLSLFPVSHVLVARWSRGRHARLAYGLAWAVGVILLLLAARLPQSGAAATLGLLAGLALWAANGELGEAAGIGVPVGPRNWSLILLLLLFLLLSPPAAYPWLAALHARLGLQGAGLRPAANVGTLAAGEFLFLTWAGHVVLLTAYYHPRLGPRSWLTYLCLALGLILTLVLLPQQLAQAGWADAVRLAVPTVIAGWSVLEILMKWGVVPKPWGGASTADGERGV